MPRIEEAFGEYREANDYRWLGPVHACPKCEAELFKLCVTFHERKVAFYFLTMECVMCGSLVLAPTEVDDVE